jgi:hypothetical protein
MNKKITIEEWNRLYIAAQKFKDSKCYKWMFNNDIFGVQNPYTGEIGYCSIMGNVGNHIAIAVYKGEKGLYEVLKLLSGEVDVESPDALFMQDCIMLSFEDRTRLTNKDLNIIKQLGLKYRGKKEWPLFRDYTPGLFPWYLNGDDCRFLTLVIEQAVEVAMLCKKDKHLIYDCNDDEFLVRVPQKNGDTFSWETKHIIPEPFNQSLFTVEVADEISVRRLKNVTPKSGNVWEIDTFYAPSPVADNGRPFYPKACLYLDHDGESILGIHLIEKLEESGYEFVDKFIDTIETMGYLPRCIYVEREETYALFNDICKKLGIELVMVETLSLMNEIRDEMGDFLSGE